MLALYRGLLIPQPFQGRNGSASSKRQRYLYYILKKTRKRQYNEAILRFKVPAVLAANHPPPAADSAGGHANDLGGLAKTPATSA